ncbi:MAG: alpha/beta fold hydrolase [Cohaesibacter sp.]|jgi:pimeloyl-ACP methyl ester carboxylesterase/DNA-binding CsgD family transcriptional regulator|nr:alpha/beta fold hydrolase [Cohaesibacter sp.]
MLNSDEETALSQTELIERIYKITLALNGHDEFMDSWASYLEGMIKNLSRTDKAATLDDPLNLTSLARHFETGLQLLEQQGRDGPFAPLPSHHQSRERAAFLLDKDRHIVWYNGAAKRHFSFDPSIQIDQLKLWEKSKPILDQFIANLDLSEPNQEDKAVVRIHSNLRNEPLFMLAELTKDIDGETRLLVKQIADNWRQATHQLLSETFSLTDAEIELIALLHEGFSSEQIALRRGRSINTVRTQIKSVLKKTDVGSQAELLRLVLSLNQVMDPQNIPTSESGFSIPASFQINDTRSVRFHQFGPRGGKPVLYIHGMLESPLLSSKIRHLAEDLNLKLIVPERPCFGSAQGDDGPIETAPDRFAADMEALLVHLGVEKTILLGHQSGVLYAFAVAARLQERAVALAAISTCLPISSSDQITAMGAYQRILAYTALHTPQFLPFILRSIIRQIDYGGQSSSLNIWLGSSIDHPHAEASGELANAISQGYYHATAQGHRALEIDSYHMARDWVWRVQQSLLPVHFFHGQKDRIVSIGDLQTFATSLKDRAFVTIDPDCDHHCFLINPEPVLASIARIEI